MLYEVFSIAVTNSLTLWNTKMFFFVFFLCFLKGDFLHNLSGIDLYVVSSHYLEFYISFLLQLRDLRNDIIHTAILTGLLQYNETNDYYRRAERESFFMSHRWIVTSSVELFIGSLDLAAALLEELPFSSFTLKRHVQLGTSSGLTFVLNLNC